MRNLEFTPFPSDATGETGEVPLRSDVIAACWSQPLADGPGAPATPCSPVAGARARGAPLRLVRVWCCDFSVAGDEWADDLPVQPAQEGDIGARYAAYLETIVHPEDTARVLGELAGALQEQRPFASRYRVRLADGSLRTLIDRGRVVRAADGTPRRLLGVTHDVTGAPGTEAAREAPASAFPFESGSLQGLLVHRGGIALYANRRLAELLGYQGAEDLLARAALQTLAADAPPEGEVRELAWPRADGDTLWVQVATQAVEWDGLAASQLAVVDITARKRLEAEVERMRSVGAAGALAAGLVHDFNNLLQIVTGSATMLGRELRPQNPARSRLDQIQHAAERGSRLVRKLLSFGHRGEVVPAELDVNDTIAAMVELMEPTLPSRYRLTFQPGEGLPAAWADATALEQMLLNLLLNARDAMPDGGVLELETAQVELSAAQARDIPAARSGPFVRVTVRDTGVGMAEEVQARMYEPFYSTKSAQSGSGLGLSVVSSLVAAHQGFLQVQSRPSIGTAVHVFLPLAPAAGAEAEPPATAGPAAAERPRQGITVLVAEADQMVACLIASFLTEAGHTAMTATKGREVLAQAGRLGAGAGMVLLSATLRDGSAHEVLATLQAAHPHLPVVITTCGALAPEETYLFQMSGRPPLRKPFQLRDLLDAVEDSQRDLVMA